MWLGLPVVTLGARFEPRGVRLGVAYTIALLLAGHGRARRRLRVRAPRGADLPVRADHRDGDPGRRRPAVRARAPPRRGHRPADRAAQPLGLRAAAGRAPAPDRPGRRVLARLPDRPTSTTSSGSTTSTAIRSATPCCATWPTPCAASCAPSTSIYRLGGEEFAILLPGADARRRRARSPSACAPRWRGSDTGGVSVTMSFGAGAVSGSDVRLAQLYAQADAALYEAKRAGRNRVGSAAAVLAALNVNCGWVGRVASRRVRSTCKRRVGALAVDVCPRMDAQRALADAPRPGSHEVPSRPAPPLPYPAEVRPLKTR